MEKEHFRVKWKGKETWLVLGVVFLILLVGWIYSIRLGDTLRYWDEEEYFIYVKNFLVTHTFTLDGIHATALRPPGYPFLLMSFAALGIGRVGLRMLNFIALAATVVILYFWLKEHSDVRAGVIGVGLTICYPVLFYAAGTFFPQTLGAFLFLLTLYLVTKKPIRIWRACLAGLLFGCLILTIPIFIFGLPLIGLWLIWRERAWQTAVLFLLVTGLMIGVWTVRNYRVFHTLVFVATDSGFNFLMGNAPETTANSGLTIDFDKYKNETIGLDEVQADAYYRARAMRFIHNYKMHALQLYFSKVLNFFNFRNDLLTQGESSSLRDIVMLVGYGGMIFILILRIISSRFFRFSDLEIFLLLLYVFSAFVYAIFFTRIRFRLPFDFLLIAVDAIFLRNLMMRWTERQLYLQRNWL
jgi:4-amino-4-deoxy-L-arabinose transferase-like glycosyltransferase